MTDLLDFPISEPPPSVGPQRELSAQLVPELLVRDLERSLSFYRSIGFVVARTSGDFAALRWGDSYLFLAEAMDRPAPPTASVVNVRVMIEDVDAAFRAIDKAGHPIEVPIGDRDYGLRDFAILDPDGFAVRFASVLPDEAPPDRKP